MIDIHRLAILWALVLALTGIALIWSPPIYRAPGDCYFCGRPMR